MPTFMAAHCTSNKKKTFFGIGCVIVLWVFYLYCTSIENIEFLDMSNNGEPSSDPHDRIGVDTAHLRAKRHRGTWIYVMNEHHQFLFVKRTKETMTCPSTWSIIGEHCKFSESYDACAKRGLREEIAVLKYQNLIPLEDDPILMHLDYGHRIDKQWTKLYIVTIAKEVLRKTDITENADFTWVNFTEVDNWLHQCPGGVCRYCNPAKVWKMDSNRKFSFYYSFIEMTVEYLHAAMAKHEGVLSSPVVTADANSVQSLPPSNHSAWGAVPFNPVVSPAAEE
jgi:isopentenyldiphosphate isomerase